jgi:hypothetical protein
MPDLSRVLAENPGPDCWPYCCRVADNAPVALNRTERTLAFIIAGVVLASILAIAAIFIAGAVGVATNSGLWLTVLVLPLIGLPLAMVLGIVLLALLTVRRRRLAPDAGR